MMTRNRQTAPTIRDVARLAGVSVATVSRHLNKTAVLTSDTAARVDVAMRELQFVPDPMARSLATHRTNTIGLLMTEIRGEYFTPLLEGVERVTNAAGYNLLIATTGGTSERRTIPLGKQNTDGVLVFWNSLQEQDLAMMCHQGHPMVLIHQSPPDNLQIPCVTIENKAAIKRVVGHLIEEHGRKRIAFVRGPQDNEDANWRELGYREALKLHGLAYDPDLVVDGEFNRDVAYQATINLFARVTDIDAVVGADDDTAIGVLRALSELKKNVPGEVSVTGFDDQVMAPFLQPPLTTVYAPTREVGEAAAHQLLNLIENRPAEPITLLPTELVLRQSCGCR
jgi:DNA-binding LacI/PurR family transcriptional regulator